MRCPKCGSRDDKVIDSRQSRDSSSIRRRRQCLNCGYRFTTYEEIERSDLRVVKRDRTHEPFDRRKLARQLAKAFEKRSVSLVTLEQTGRRNCSRTGNERPRSHSRRILAPKCWRNSAKSMKSLTCVMHPSIGASPMWTNLSTPFTRLAVGSKPNSPAARIVSSQTSQSWSRLRKNFHICAAIPGNCSNSIAIGCMPRSIGLRIRLVIQAGGSPNM